LKLFKLVFCLFLLTCQLSVYAQQRTGNEGSSGGDASIKNLEFASLDTSSYQYFTLDDLKAKSVFKDSMIHNFSNYAPDRNADDPHLTLGNLGSAARPVLFKVNQNIGNQLGFHQYELYHKNLRNFRFMDVNIPFNNLFFSPLSGQQNFMVKANFSRNFKENTNFTLDYERLRQDGFYNQQGTKSTSFGVGVWNKSENLKRNTFFLLKASNNDESQNGGVANIDYTDLDAIFRQLNIAQRNAIVVNSRTAESRRQLYSYEMHNFYQLSNFKLQHSISFTKGYYRFYDTESIPSIVKDIGAMMPQSRLITEVFKSKQEHNIIAVNLILILIRSIKMIYCFMVRSLRIGLQSS